MQAIRANLTRMKKSIQEKLPEGDDVFGFSGIDKEALIDCVNDAYQLSYKLADLEPKFEITILKRKISNLIDSCKEYLSKDTEQWGKEKKFDKFVTDLTKIREEIRITYLVVVDNALRTESQANKIISDYKILTSAYGEYKEQFSLIEEKLETVESSHDQVLKLEKLTESLYSAISESSEKISSLQNESESSFEFTSKYESEVKERRQYVVDLANKLGSMEKRTKGLNTKAEVNRKEFEQLKEDLKSQVALNDAQQIEIQNTLDNANRMGMAGSFKSRKEELNTPIKVWGIVFVCAILAIFFTGYHFITPALISTIEVNYLEVAIKTILVSPFIWLAWMSVKQYGYLSRIREDYAYKYASAMAFEGYKKHAVQIDEKLLKQLIQVSIDNLSQNPIRLFSAKDNHGSPANELMRDVINVLKDQKNGVSKVLGGDKTDNKGQWQLYYLVHNIEKLKNYGALAA